MQKREPSPFVLAIGHSTRTFEAFIVLLQAHGATRVNELSAQALRVTIGGHDETKRES